MRLVLREVGSGEERPEDGQPGLPVSGSGLGLAPGLEEMAQAQQSLGGDGGGGAVDRLVGVEGVGGAVEVVAEAVELRGAGVPVGDAVDGGLVDVEVAGGAGGLEHEALDLLAAAEPFELGVGDGLEEFELFGVAEHDPGEAAGPGGEGRVALLGVGAAELAVVGVEDALVGDAAAAVVGVAPLAVEDGVGGGGPGVLDEPSEQGDFGVLLVVGEMAEPVGHRQGAQRADGVGEERVRPVEGVDEAAAVLGAGPAPGLDGSGAFQRQGVEIPFPGVGGDFPLVHQPGEVAVGADVVEAVVMDAEVGEVRGHVVDDVAPGPVQAFGVAGGVELEQPPSEEEALGPFRPAPGAVLALDREHRGAVRWPRPPPQRLELLPRKLEQAPEPRLQVAGPQAVVDRDHLPSLSLALSRSMNIASAAGRTSPPMAL